MRWTWRFSFLFPFAQSTNHQPAAKPFMFYECHHSICKIRKYSPKKTMAVNNAAVKVCKHQRKNDVCARAFKYSVYTIFSIKYQKWREKHPREKRGREREKEKKEFPFPHSLRWLVAQQEENVYEYDMKIEYERNSHAIDTKENWNKANREPERPSKKKTLRLDDWH